MSFSVSRTRPDELVDGTIEGRVAEATFEEILPIWEKRLWPGRSSAIEPVSAIDSFGQINLIWREAKPRFWKIQREQDVTGVISALFLASHSARLRGLWVSKSARGRGFGRVLVHQALQEARAHRLTWAWTMARGSAEPFYRACGFRSVASTSQYEFGPHVLMRIELASSHLSFDR